MLGGTGRSAVRGRSGVGGRLMMSGITCCMTAGVRGIAIVPFAVVAGMKDLRGFVAGSWSFPVCEEIHYRIVEDYCIGEGVAADVVAAARLPSEEFDVGDENAMPVVSAGNKEAVAVGHVYH